MNDRPVTLAPTKAPVIEGVFAYTGKTCLDAAGVAPGKRIEVRLRLSDRDAVGTPGDAADALRQTG